MLIAFIHRGKAFLPEINAYQHYFSEHGIDSVVVKEVDNARILPDVEWHFMGTNFRRKFPGKLLIHEYASASVPPFALAKNRLKKAFNAKPDARVFLNETVSGAFSFSDGKPIFFRDMGIAEGFLNCKLSVAKEFDYVYCGALPEENKLEELLSSFAVGHFKDRSLLLLSANYSEWQHRYKLHNNIKFEGPVPNHDVPNILNKCRYGINIRPAIMPYDVQTSTKILEYCACRLPVLTSKTSWTKEFEKNSSANFFYLPEKFESLKPEEIENYPFVVPDVQDWHWNKQIEKSGILQYLLETVKA